MSDYWREQLRVERERYRRETGAEATDTERGIARAWREQLRVERERYRRETGAEATDTERGIEVETDAPAAPTDRRRAAIQALIDRGATEGEREAARAALQRLERDAQDEADFEDAYMHGAA